MRVCVCAKARTSVSSCVTVDVLSKGLHRSVRGPLIRRSMTRLLSTALEMGGCVPGGRRGCLDTDETVDLTHRFTRSHTNRMCASSFKCDASRRSKSTADTVLNNAVVCACMCVLLYFLMCFDVRLEISPKKQTLNMLGFEIVKLERLKVTVSS